LFIEQKQANVFRKSYLTEDRRILKAKYRVTGGVAGIFQPSYLTGKRKII